MAADADGGHELAIRTAVAVLSGAAAAVAGADAGAVATAATPLAEAIASWAVVRLGRRRVEHAAETLIDAATFAGDPLPEFIDKAIADDRRHELFARSMTIAQDTALRSKRLALGRALANGVIGDDARIDDELLVIRAIADLDEPHIRLLGLLGGHAARHGEKTGTPLQAGWPVGAIMKADPGLGSAVPALLSTLQLHALVREELNSPYVGPGWVGPGYNITGEGRRLLTYLRTQEPA